VDGQQVAASLLVAFSQYFVDAGKVCGCLSHGNSVAQGEQRTGRWLHSAVSGRIAALRRNGDRSKLSQVWTGLLAKEELPNGLTARVVRGASVMQEQWAQLLEVLEGLAFDASRSKWRLHLMMGDLD
jgi:hypothetical protein